MTRRKSATSAQLAEGFASGSGLPVETANKIKPRKRKPLGKPVDMLAFYQWVATSALTTFNRKSAIGTYRSFVRDSLAAGASTAEISRDANALGREVQWVRDKLLARYARRG